MLFVPCSQDRHSEGDKMNHNSLTFGCISGRCGKLFSIKIAKLFPGAFFLRPMANLFLFSVSIIECFLHPPDETQ